MELFLIYTGTDLTSSDTKSTTDIEDLVWAVFWILLFLGLLMGLLNQRHIAANSVLEVPLGRPPLFGYLWAGAGFTFSVLAAVFSWPLFGKHKHTPTYMHTHPSSHTLTPYLLFAQTANSESIPTNLCAETGQKPLSIFPGSGAVLLSF